MIGVSAETKRGNAGRFGIAPTAADGRELLIDNLVRPRNGSAKALRCVAAETVQ